MGLTGTSVNSFAARMAAGELMVRAGTNVVNAQDNGWDSHHDASGDQVRNRLVARIATPLNKFLTRMVQDGAAQRNVIVAILGDFHRSLPDSDHQANLAALVIGKTLKTARTGRTDARVGLPSGTPGIAGFWQLAGTAARLDTNPFGPNPHPTLLAT
jgi:hypothetical protein